ncbi:MAG: hypothetical protein LC776_06160 [Acidobacteria bacterium]|nr:hypothetical protein [Acidobacteriota bacterium]
MSATEPTRFSDDLRFSELAAQVLQRLVTVLSQLQTEDRDERAARQARWIEASDAVGLNTEQLEILAAVATAAAAAALAASRQRCPTKINGEYSDIDEYFPTDTTPHHYRCKHNPPHCWDSNKTPLSQCPGL